MKGRSKNDINIIFIIIIGVTTSINIFVATIIFRIITIIITIHQYITDMCLTPRNFCFSYHI